METDQIAEPGGAPSDMAIDFRQALLAATPRLLVTPLLIAANMAVFAVMTFRGVNPVEPNFGDLLRWGANFGPLTTSGEWWRLFTSLFLHVGVAHLLLNMFALWVVGRFEERVVGNIGFLILYIVSGLFASLASVRFNVAIPSAGASGAIFGVCGGFMAFLFKERALLPRPILRRFGMIMTAFVVMNIVIGFESESIDLAAHLGGLAAGFGCGMVMSHTFSIESVALRGRRNLAVIFGGAMLLVACAVVMPKSSRHLADALIHIEKKEFDLAIADLDRVIAQDAGNLEAFQSRAVCFMGQRKFDEAIRDFDEALSLRPSNIMAMLGRAQAFMQVKKYQKALDDLDRAVQLANDNYALMTLSALLNARGFAYLMLDRDTLAEDDWRKAAENGFDSKSKAGNLENISLIHLKNKAWSRVVNHAAEVDKLNSDSAWNNLFKAIAADQMGERDLAADSHAKWQKLKTEDDIEQLQQYLPESLRSYLDNLSRDSAPKAPAHLSPNSA